jgi:hypothetical protein
VTESFCCAWVAALDSKQPTMILGLLGRCEACKGPQECVISLLSIERIISLLSASPVGEARLPMPKGMAYKD